MNTQDNTIQNESEIIMSITTGQQLREVREEKKLTQDEVAKQLFLSKEIIIGLENDDYSKMVAPVYIRGYLAAYARLLQIPSENMLKEFKQTTASNEVVGTDEINQIKILHPIKIASHQEQYGLQWATYTIIVILIIAVSMWGYNHHKNNLLKNLMLPKNNNDFTLPSPQESLASPTVIAPPITPIKSSAPKTSQTTSNIAILPLVTSVNKTDIKPNDKQEKDITPINEE